LIDPIQRDIEASAAFVLDDRDVERLGFGAHRDRLQTPIDTDAMLEMDDIATWRQWPGRRRRDRGAVAPWTPQPPRASKDLVVGKHPQRRHDEAAVERADGQCGLSGAEQLLEPLELSFVVAQDDRWWRIRDDLAQALEIAIDVLGRRQREAPLRFTLREREPREPTYG
jgi:hypothetical protein